MSKKYVVLARLRPGILLPFDNDTWGNPWMTGKVAVFTSHEDYEVKRNKPLPSAYEKKRRFNNLLDTVKRLKIKYGKTVSKDIFIARVGADTCPIKVNLSSKGSSKEFVVKREFQVKGQVR